MSSSGLNGINTHMFFRMMSNWADLPAEFKKEYKTKKTGQLKSPKKEMDKILHFIKTSKDGLNCGFDEKVIGNLSPILRNHLCFWDYKIINCTLEQQERIIGYIENNEPERRQYIIRCFDGPLIVFNNFDQDTLDKINAYVSGFFKNTTCSFVVEDIIIDESLIPEFIEEEYTHDNIKKEFEEDKAFDLKDTDEYKEFKVEFEKKHAHIQIPLNYTYTSRLGTSLLSFGDLSDLYGSKYIMYGPKKGGDFATNIWKKDPNRRSYLNMDFLPSPQVCPPDTFNSWEGFKIQGDATKGTYEPFVNHLKILNDETDYVLRWFAQIIQQPGNLSLTSVIIEGEHGCGKGVQYDIMERLLGKHASMSSSLSDIFAKHSEHRNGKLLIHYDEGDKKEGFAFQNMLKSAITSTKHKYEAKGSKPLDLLNCNRFMITKNPGSLSVPIEDTERRYAVFKCDSRYRGDKDYFDKLYQWMENDDNIAAVYEYLLTVEIGDLKDIPHTEILDDMKQMSLPLFIKWLTNLVVENFPTTWIDKPISLRSLCDSYSVFIGKTDISPESLGRLISKSEFVKAEAIKKSRNSKGYIYTFDRGACFEIMKNKRFTSEETLQSTVDITVGDSKV